MSPNKLVASGPAGLNAMRRSGRDDRFAASFNEPRGTARMFVESYNAMCSNRARNPMRVSYSKNIWVSGYFSCSYWCNLSAA